MYSSPNNYELLSKFILYFSVTWWRYILSKIVLIYYIIYILHSIYISCRRKILYNYFYRILNCCIGSSRMSTDTTHATADPFFAVIIESYGWNSWDNTVCFFVHKQASYSRKWSERHLYLCSSKHKKVCGFPCQL
jgi:hypothetical protein